MTRQRVEAGPGAQPRRAAGRGRRARPRGGRRGGGVRRARGDRPPADRARRRACDMRHFDRYVRDMTNRLRTEGTDHLLAAGRAVGARRFVAQSYAGWPYARTGGPVQDRGRPARPRPAGALRAALDAHPPPRAGGDRRRGGPRGSRCATAASTARARASAWRRTRRWPSRSASAGSRSSATAAASGRSSTSRTPRRRPSPRSSTARRGVYNIVDDEPAPVAEWLPALGERARRQAAAARPALARAARGRRGGDAS